MMHDASCMMLCQESSPSLIEQEPLLCRKCTA